MGLKPVICGSPSVRVHILLKAFAVANSECLCPVALIELPFRLYAPEVMSECDHLVSLGYELWISNCSASCISKSFARICTTCLAPSRCPTNGIMSLGPGTNQATSSAGVRSLLDCFGSTMMIRSLSFSSRWLPHAQHGHSRGERLKKP